MSRRLAALAGGCVLWSIVAPALGAGPALQSPEVIHTGKGPTGYTVTFRYANPTAQKVQIRGDWYFARPGELAQIAGTPDHPVVQGQGLLPQDWRPGDFTLQHPNAVAGNFPTADMTKGKDGVWTFTTPLPSGTFSYSFLVDCPAPQPQQGGPGQCRPGADPANPPWNRRAGAAVGPAVNSSQVFVPSDPAFHTVDYSWQGPAKLQGKLSLETYASPGHLTPADENTMVVYTPPNYDAARAQPYPTLYLSGGSEMAWSTQGVVANILDNLINTGQIQPLVVVMPNAQGYDESGLFAAYDRDVIERMFPFVEQRYHVSTSGMDRAFSGFSFGGMLTNTFALRHPEAFQYYGIMSVGLPAEYATLTPAQIAGLQGKVIWIGSGWQDAIHVAGYTTGSASHTGPARMIATFAKAGLPVTTDFVHGGHSWYVWRILLKDFLTRSAFLPAPYATR
jgi:enterochelin esterase-like enzyme